ncbi:MAG: SDR family NAD(P)-dependent oxidoreductase [Thermoleophilia bacterium]|nr:SDR family NAD(P)-dependent oxidoreductase [Thermoleophilia bacterium]
MNLLYSDKPGTGKLSKPEGAVTVITGASSGIGRATALKLSRLGARTVLVSRQQQALDDLAARCHELGGSAVAMAADVADEDAMNEVVRFTVAELGGLDVWINNAGVTLYGQLDQVPSEDFRRVVDTNLFGYVNGARAVLPVFRRQDSGTLINVASIVGKGGQAWADAYVVSKFGVYGLSTALRQNLIDHKNINVVTVIPPSVDTPLFQHGGNFTGRAARAIWPAQPAEKVASAIINAMENPRRQVVVGFQARLGVLASQFFPALSEPVFARITRSRHFQNVPQPPTHGNLFVPDPDWNRVSGGWRRPLGITAAARLVTRLYRLVRRR